MSNIILSKRTGYILYKIGDKTLKSLMDDIKGIDDINNIVLSSITETPSFREGLSASVEDQESFVKYIEMMQQYVASMGPEDSSRVEDCQGKESNEKIQISD